MPPSERGRRWIETRHALPLLGGEGAACETGAPARLGALDSGSRVSPLASPLAPRGFRELKVKGSTPRAAWEPRGYWGSRCTCPGDWCPWSGSCRCGASGSSWNQESQPQLCWGLPCPVGGGGRIDTPPFLRCGSGAQSPLPLWTRSLSPCRPRPGVPCVLPRDGSLIPWCRVTRTWRALRRGLLGVRPKPRDAAAGSPISLGVGEAGGCAPGWFSPPALSATMPALVPDPLFPSYWSG